MGSDGSDALQMIPILAKEIRLYPKSLLRKLGLREISLVQNLSFGGQRRKAVPHFSSGILFYDVLIGNYSQVYLRKVLHHEIFHFADHFHSKEGLYKDSIWEQVNPEGFKYGGGGGRSHFQEMVMVNFGDLTSHLQIQTSESNPAPKGFLNQYCLSGVEEDKAEFFSAMMTEISSLLKDCERDEILMNKLNLMVDFVAKLCPKELKDLNSWISRGSLNSPISFPPRPLQNQTQDEAQATIRTKNPSEDFEICSFCSSKVEKSKLQDHINKGCDFNLGGSLSLMFGRLSTKN